MDGLTAAPVWSLPWDAGAQRVTAVVPASHCVPQMAEVATRVSPQAAITPPSALTASASEAGLADAALTWMLAVQLLPDFWRTRTCLFVTRPSIQATRGAFAAVSPIRGQLSAPAVESSLILVLVDHVVVDRGARRRGHRRSVVAEAGHSESSGLKVRSWERLG